jgi:hypothetical protein
MALPFTSRPCVAAGISHLQADPAGLGPTSKNGLILRKFDYKKDRQNYDF